MAHERVVSDDVPLAEGSVDGEVALEVIDDAGVPRRVAVASIHDSGDVTAVIESDRLVTTYPCAAVAGELDNIAALVGVERGGEPVVRPTYGCTACHRTTADPAELMIGRAGTIWCRDAKCPGEMVTPPPAPPEPEQPVPDTTAKPDRTIVRIVTVSPDGDAHIEGVEAVRQNTVDVIRELLAEAEAGKVREFVGIGYDEKGTPILFCSHDDHGRAMGALVMAQSEVVRMWREGDD